MGIIHKFTGTVGQNYDWEGERVQSYPQHPGAELKWLLGKADGVPTFAVRYFELPPEGKSNPEQHPYEHGLIIVRGHARISLGTEKQESEVGPFDIVFIPPDEYHQIINDGQEVFGAFCTIPAYRRKGDTLVYAEGALSPDTANQDKLATGGDQDDQ